LHCGASHLDPQIVEKPAALPARQCVEIAHAVVRTADLVLQGY